MIEIKNLTVQFEKRLILDNISSNIEENKITSIIGKSGTGKSVFMKAVIGLIKPDNGDIIIDSVLINNLKKHEIKQIKMKIAMLFQNSALFDSLNVFQNIAFPLFEHTKLPYEEIFEKVKSMIKLVNLPDILNSYPSELSGGMRKRVALARAIIQKPKYLIYDEPTTGLDPVTADEIINLIASIHRELSMSSIVITHDPECIKQLSEKLIMIDSTKIIFQDDFSKFKNFNHPVAKSFIKHIF